MLNIGLRGSMAIKQPNTWWTNPDAFPVRTLRLVMGGFTSPQRGTERRVAKRPRCEEKCALPQIWTATVTF